LEKTQKQFCPSKVLGSFCPGKVLGVFQSGDNCPPERHVGQATKIWFFEKPKTKPVLVYPHHKLWYSFYAV
jgi:hypothetical protein